MKVMRSINALGLDGYTGCDRSLSLRVTSLASKAMKATAAMQATSTSTTTAAAASAEVPTDDVDFDYA